MCDALRPSGVRPLVRERTGWSSTRTSPAPRSPGCWIHVPWARSRAERGELAFGTVDSWLVWKLTGGRVHVHRRHQRLAHALPGPALGGVGSRDAGAADDPRARCPTVVDSRPIAETSDRGWLPAGVRSRHAGRTSRRRSSADVLRGRQRQEHVRHRVLRPAEHRQRPGGLRSRPRHHRGLAHRRPDHLCAGGQRVHRRGRRAVAARRTRRDRSS
jgi:hypothetical protein